MNFKGKWQWTFEDFQVLNSAYSDLTKARRIRKYLLPVLVVLVSLLAAFMFWSGDNVGGWLSVLYVVLLLGLKYVLTPWAQRRRFNQQDLEGQEVAIEADDAGVRVQTVKANSNHVWDGFPNVTALEGHTILWQNKILGIAIPDRAFASPEEARRFAKFAKEKSGGK